MALLQAHRPSTAAPRRAPAIEPAVRPRLIRELLLIAAMYAVYRLGRMAAEGRIGEAYGNAAAVWRFERDVHLPSETGVQHVLLHSPTLVGAANTFYATAHFPATVLFLAWMYLRRPAHYLRTRRVLALLTAAALVLHMIMPLAPPRMLPSTGLVDTGRLYGPSVYGNPHTDTLSNQFAAMPSLHVGWALVVAVGLIATTRGRLRWLWLLHPAITLIVVVGTANHYWSDCIAAALLLAIAYAVIPQPHPRTSAGSGQRWTARVYVAWSRRRLLRLTDQLAGIGCRTKGSGAEPRTNGVKAQRRPTGVPDSGQKTTQPAERSGTGPSTLHTRYAAPLTARGAAGRRALQWTR